VRDRRVDVLGSSLGAFLHDGEVKTLGVEVQGAIALVWELEPEAECLSAPGRGRAPNRVPLEHERCLLGEVLADRLDAIRGSAGACRHCTADHDTEMTAHQ